MESKSHTYFSTGKYLYWLLLLISPSMWKGLSTTMAVGLWIFCILYSPLALAIFDDDWDLNLPEDQIQFYFFQRKDLAEQCNNSDYCPYKEYVNSTRCWGYEKECKQMSQYYSYPKCHGSADRWGIEDKKEQAKAFWNQGDFGYLKKYAKTMKILCEPEDAGDSSLVCAKNMVYCEASNLYMDFRGLNSSAYTGNLMLRYREDVFSDGQVGGHCKLKKRLLSQQNEWMSALQSWFAELRTYSSLNFKPLEKQSQSCDLVLDKPTVFMKLDAGVNLFHHYCDFVNLYASQHLNGSFSQDVTVVMWDTSGMDYGDLFSESWRAFTRGDVIHLREFDGKRVCVRDALFPLLARMRLGLYYNMPVIPGCTGSGLFKAFNHHMIHRLKIPQNGPLENKVRVTILSRSTKYRRILNEDELFEALEKEENIHATRVDYRYRSMSFLEQVSHTHNTDVLIGMHGAGLAHVLFLPDWGTLFELYNCDDPMCYNDLARLRGANYTTWERDDKLHQEDAGHHPTLGEHKKFTNYAFDGTEFMRKVRETVKYVKDHPAWQAAHKVKYSEQYAGAKDEL